MRVCIGSYFFETELPKHEKSDTRAASGMASAGMAALLRSVLTTTVPTLLVAKVFEECRMC